MILGAVWLGDWGEAFEIGGLWRQGGSGVSGADLGGGHEVDLETVDGREDGLAWFGVTVGAADEANDEVGLSEYDPSLSEWPELVL